jgi:hypothetical protein
MQQRNQQLTRQTNQPQTLASAAKNRIMIKHGMTEQEWLIYDAEISFGLLTLRTAFPTQSRNYSDSEFDMLTALWLEIFAEVERGILNEAILRFVKTDRKGFFPSPGQIVGIIEDIQAERKAVIEEERRKQHWARVNAHENRVKNGENCSTCRFCVCRKEKSMWDNSIEDNLYCRNPDSDKYEGDTDHKWGTVADYLYDFYIPNNDNK